MRKPVLELLNEQGSRVRELEGEIERLRAALQEIHDFPYVGAQASQAIQTIARAALSAGKCREG